MAKIYFLYNGLTKIRIFFLSRSKKIYQSTSLRSTLLCSNMGLRWVGRSETLSILRVSGFMGNAFSAQMSYAMLRSYKQNILGERCDGLKSKYQ